jgi:N-acyl-D-amino-acid deacylase
MAHDTTGKDQDIILRGGLIADGSGEPPFTANILIRAGRIHRISPKPIRSTGVVIDCAGRVVAPGFIDAHSHLDWQIPLKGHDELKYPFLAQGITTVIAGNCGIAAAAFRPETIWKSQLEAAQVGSPLLGVQWSSVAELFERLRSSGTSHNIALLAGHGSTRLSIRAGDPSPLHPYETKEMLFLLEKALQEGARGISIGLQHEPGFFARPEELREVALLVKAKGRILAIHPRTAAAVTPGQRSKLFGEAHNLIALREVLDLARATGVRLQISHLSFLGSRTWRTVTEALSLIDAAQADGVDVRFDMHPMSCAASIVSELMPVWFRAHGAAAYADAAAMRRVRRELRVCFRRLGFGPSDIEITDTLDEDTEEYSGKNLTEIARLRRMNPVDALVDIARRSGGHAKLLCRKQGNDRITETLMRHPAALFMTDAWVEPKGTQNPAAFGSFPRLLQMARERGVMRVEETVRKMSGATAERFGLAGRGLLREGMAADITVFDWENVSDTTTPAEADSAPTGIDYVFVNGKKIIGSGKKENPLNAGVPLP